MKPAGVSVITVIILALLILSSGCTGPASPAGPVPLEKPVFVNATTNETLVAFVHEAVAYAKIHGKDAALAEFSNPEGSFVRGELYIFAYDFASTTLAHPFSPEKIGINRMNEPDAFGNLYAQGFIDAINKGDGFVWFYYKNPAHNDSIEKKLGYVAKVDDDWWLGSGVYYGPAEPVIPPIQKSPSTTQEIKDFVDSAVAYAQENGKDAALAMFNDPAGRFTRGDLYIYALDYAGNALALPFQPQLVGTSFYNTQDSSGRYYTRTEIQLCREGGGYLLYQYPDPAENFTVRYKVSYVRPVDDTYWIGAGIYSGEDRLIDPELKQFVADAKSYATTNGRERALAGFNDVNGSFIRDDLYIFAYDYSGNTLAWPYRPDLIGTNRLDATDPVGSHHIRAMTDTARKGEGMVEYYSVNPATNTTQLKISYVMDVDGTWLLGAGRYVEPGPVNLRG